MLTSNKKAGKDKSCSQNSNQKYSTVPCNHAVEAGEMVTMDHGGTFHRGGLDNDGQQMDYLQVAWLLREKLNDLVDGNKREFLKLGLRSLLDMASSHKIVFVDPKMMNPILWRTLPKELLILVLARLPVSDIVRLRWLSREWWRDMTTVNSEFNQVCDTVSPIMVAGFSCEDYTLNGVLLSGFLVTICDLSTHRPRCSYRVRDKSINGQWNDMGAFDGGLVCLVSAWRPNIANPMCIVVWNLLTRVWRKLPPLQYDYLTLPQMMDIEVDSKTKCYRVVVVGENMEGHPIVEIYDSGAKQWTKATPPLVSIFGVAYTWEYCNMRKTFKDKKLAPSVYDFAEGQLKRFDFLTGPASVMAWAFQKDYIFVLHRNTSNGEMLPMEGFHITKYRIQSNAKDWVQERSYLCSPLDDLLKEFYYFKITLKACEGFLMVFLVSFGNFWDFWVLDLFTGEWSRFSNCFRGREYKTSMCRSFWNVPP